MNTKASNQNNKRIALGLCLTIGQLLVNLPAKAQIPNSQFQTRSVVSQSDQDIRIIRRVSVAHNPNDELMNSGSDLLAIGGSGTGGGDVVFCKNNLDPSGSRLKPYFADSAELILSSKLSYLEKLGSTEADYLEKIFEQIKIKNETVASVLKSKVAELRFLGTQHVDELEDDNINLNLINHNLQNFSCTSKSQLALQDLVTKTVFYDINLYNSLSTLERAIFKLHEGFISLLKSHDQHDTTFVRNVVRNMIDEPSFDKFLNQMLIDSVFHIKSQGSRKFVFIKVLKDTNLKHFLFRGAQVPSGSRKNATWEERVKDYDNAINFSKSVGDGLYCELNKVYATSNDIREVLSLPKGTTLMFDVTDNNISFSGNIVKGPSEINPSLRINEDYSLNCYKTDLNGNIRSQNLLSINLREVTGGILSASKEPL